jgi:uncharacterized protein (TIRG00374 family)
LDSINASSTEHVPGGRENALSAFPVRKVLVVLFGAILIVTAMALIADARELGDRLTEFKWILVLPILLLTLWNYALRFAKWELYLRTIGVADLPRVLSARIFLAGFAMSITPGKVGEFIKAVYVRRETGRAANPVMAVVTAERATDAAAMAVLALIGATQYSYGRGFVFLAITGGMICWLILRSPGLVERVIGRLSHVERVGRLSNQIVAFFHASAALLHPRLLAPTVALSVLSWAGECLAFYLVLIGLGLEATPELLLIAAFIIGVSSLAGGISMLPGGLGVADASVAGMLVLLVHDDAMSRSVAIAATLLIRFATLWFGVLIGAISLASMERRQNETFEPKHAHATAAPPS